MELMEEAFQHNTLIFSDKIVDIGTNAGFRKLKKQLYSKEWVVFSKQPFGGHQASIVLFEPVYTSSRYLK